MSEGNEQLDANQGNSQVWDYALGRMVDRNAPPPEIADYQARLEALNANTKAFSTDTPLVGRYAQGGTGDEAFASNQLAALRRWDPNAKATGMEWVKGADADTERGWNSGHFNVTYDYDKSKVPVAAKGLEKLTEEQRSQFNFYDGKDLEDVKKQTKYGFTDDSKVFYDPDFGYYTHNSNVVHKEGWKDQLMKYAPDIIIALGTMGMSLPEQLAVSTALHAGTDAANGMKIGDIAKHAGIGLATGALGAGLGSVMPDVNLGPVGNISGATLGRAAGGAISQFAQGKPIGQILTTLGFSLAGSLVSNASGQVIGSLTDDKFVQWMLKQGAGVAQQAVQQKIQYPNGAQQQRPVVRPPTPRITYPTGGH